MRYPDIIWQPVQFPERVPSCLIPQIWYIEHMEDIGAIIVWDCLLNVRSGMPTQIELHSRLRTSFHVALFSSVDIAPSDLMLSTNPAEWESKAIWSTTPDLAITRRLGCNLSLWLQVLHHHTGALCCLVLLRSSPEAGHEEEVGSMLGFHPQSQPRRARTGGENSARVSSSFLYYGRWYQLGLLRRLQSR